MDLQLSNRVINVPLNTTPPESIRIAFRYMSAETNNKNTILLLHGFPQTSYQFHRVMPMLATHGYACIAPDYRGAGGSSKPLKDDFRKSTMADDMIALLDTLGLHNPVHVVGHDIGGMIAYAMAARHPRRVCSVIWGECPLPGTVSYTRDVSERERSLEQFHFLFHAVPDLPEALVAGRERVYVEHFFAKLVSNRHAFTAEDVDHYAAEYAKPGAMRSAMGLYRALEVDAQENREWIEQRGKCSVPTLVLTGEDSRYRSGREAIEMVKEVADKFEITSLSGVGHYLAEEAPKRFARNVLDFIGNHDAGSV